MPLNLIWIIVAVLIAGVLVWGLDQLPAIDPTFKQVAKVIIIVVVVIWSIVLIVGMLGAGAAWPRWR